MADDHGHRQQVGFFIKDAVIQQDQAHPVLPDRGDDLVGQPAKAGLQVGGKTGAERAVAVAGLEARAFRVAK